MVPTPLPKKDESRPPGGHAKAGVIREGASKVNVIEDLKGAPPVRTTGAQISFRHQTMAAPGGNLIAGTEARRQ